MSKKPILRYSDLFSERGRTKLASVHIASEGGKYIDALKEHNYLYAKYGEALKVARFDKKRGWELLGQLIKEMESEQILHAYANFWKKEDAEKEYIDLKGRVKQSYVDSGVYWMSRSDDLAHRAVSVPYTCDIKCSLGEYCMARAFKDRRGDEGRLAILIEPIKGAVNIKTVEAALTEIARVCDFTYPQLVVDGNRIVVQENLDLLELIKNANSGRLWDKLKAVAVALEIKDKHDSCCVVDVTGTESEPVAILSSQYSTISLSEIKTRSNELADYLGVKSVQVSPYGEGRIKICEDKSREIAASKAVHKDPHVRVSGLCMNLDLKDSSGSLCQSFWYSVGGKEVIKFISESGYLKAELVECVSKGILSYMGWSDCKIYQEGGTVNVVRDESDLEFREKVKSDNMASRASALPYRFALKDVVGGDVVAEYIEDDNYILLTSEGARDVPFDSVMNRIHSIEQFLEWKNLMVSVNRAGLMIHDHTCKQSSVYIPSLVKLNDTLEDESRLITYGITNGGKKVLENLDDFKSTLIVGKAGSGKSNFMKALIYQLARNLSNGVDEFVGIDLKALLTFGSLEGLKNFKVTDTAQGAIEIIEYVLSEVERRNAEARESRSPNGVYQGGSLIFLIDEYSEIKSKIPQSEVGRIKLAMDRILKIGRSAKVLVLACMQNSTKDAVEKSTKDQFSNFFMFQVLDKGYADSMYDGAEVLAEKGWRPITLNKGRCIVQLDGESDLFQMQVPLIENDAFDELMVDLVGKK
ncbi:FtsK/SpoIIIE domain-containing protein [Vibrio sp. D431a]|uniref:FtsK/SpoIIIE domain-containing protein n=1 Tax=Vibrio sp. D431a TaxID=2837388 RepID=UPI0025552E21|nr:FtsK/SpoIIIE domain-containing protein [Vibrio sp. D431a]MDK9790043.1 hypothetical protein [Vibrio sp. D431a]